MCAFVPHVPRHSRGDNPPSASTASPAVLTLTGERTIPDLDIENYWFRRHQVVYQRLAPLHGPRRAGSRLRRGYGADLIACVARQVIAVDYDETAVAHVRSRYPRVEVMQANLAELPLPDASVDVVVNFQVIEHLWDQARFVRECARVLRGSGLLMVSTPNRITFSPAAIPRSTHSTPASSMPTSSLRC